MGPDVVYLAALLIGAGMFILALVLTRR